MNPTVFCPHCRQHLPVQAIPPAGTAVQCYHCGATFVLGQSPPAYGPPSHEPRPAPAHWQAAPSYGPSAGYGQAPPPKPGPLPPKSSAPIWIAVGCGAGSGLLLLLIAVWFVTRQAGPQAVATNTPPAAVAPVAPTSATPVTQSPPSTPPNTTPSAPNAAPPASSSPPAASPTPAPVSATTAPAPESALSYRFQPGMRYHYSFQLKVDGGGDDYSSPARFGGLPRPFPTRATNEYHGSVFYEPREVEPHLITELLGDKTGEGSGTAFVVHSDGYLVTCEHVVRSAAKVEVTLNQTTYPARVLAADRKHDLAILKIEAKGLKSLALGNSDQVQLAEEVRAVGFPLSDVLGTSVKITRGTVSGVVERGEKLLQIDASINPGNSGGPLVNAKGEVMGVCSSGLFGESISHVGFAVPANQVRQLLQSKGYATNGTAVSAPLDGPELARQVTPGVAFVKVTLGADAANACLLNFSGMVSSPGSYGMNDNRGQVLLTRDGEVTSIKGDGSLPFLVGTYGGLVIDKLPYAGETAWESRNVCSLSITTTQEDNSPFGGSFPGRLGGRFRSPFDPRPQQQVTVVPAVETTSWKLGPRTGDIQVINKHYEFATSEKDKETKLVEMSGDGTVSFDVSQGIPKECKMTFNYRGTRGNVTVRLPITFTYQLFKAQTEAEWQQALKEATERNKAAVAAASPQPSASSTPSTPITPGTSTAPFGSGATAKPEKPDNTAKVRDLLQKIASDRSNIGQLYTHLSNLSFMEPIPELRDEVSKSIDPLLISKESLARSGAINVAKKWFTENNVPTLLKLLDSLDDSARHNALECLGMHSKDLKVAQKIAEALKQSSDRSYAEQALQKMGPVAEEAVLPLLTEDDEEIRSAICDVLRDTGTAKCMPELEKLAQNKSNRSVKSRAESALREVNRRMGKQG